MGNGISITVGLKDADIVGSDNRALQAAVDYVAGLGGGTVEIGVGTYLMNDSLHLRNNVNLIGQGEGINWPDLDEDISVENMLLGKPSGESQRSFKRWLRQHSESSDSPATTVTV